MRHIPLNILKFISHPSVKYDQMMYDSWMRRTVKSLFVYHTMYFS